VILVTRRKREEARGKREEGRRKREEGYDGDRTSQGGPNQPQKLSLPS